MDVPTARTLLLFSWHQLTHRGMTVRPVATPAVEQLLPTRVLARVSHSFTVRSCKRSNPHQ